MNTEFVELDNHYMVMYDSRVYIIFYDDVDGWVLAEYKFFQFMSGSEKVR